MAKALKSGKVDSYAYEAEDLEHTPLASLENAVGIKGYGWYTREALDNMFKIWVDNIEGLINGKPKNIVNL
jgi:lactate dehydrogenase-like 2-hydroxyacid dehydrogenase